MALDIVVDLLNMALGRQADAFPNNMESRNNRQLACRAESRQEGSGAPSRGTTQLSASNLVDETLQSELDQQAARFTELNKEHADLGNKYRNAMGKISRLKTLAEDHCQKHNIAQTEYGALKRELEICRDDLLKMQPVGKVPDSLIVQAYDDLQEKIAGWTANEISQIESNSHTGNHESLPNLFHHGGYPAVEHFLATFPTSGGEYILRFLLQGLIQKSFLSADTLLVGLDEPEEMLLRRIEDDMSKLTPPREAESVSSWRSETLRALSASQTFKENRQRMRRQIGIRVLNKVAEYFPFIEKIDERLQEFCTRVLDPAFELATTIQTSSTRYQFAPDLEHFFPHQGDALKKQDMSTLTLIDAATGRTLKSDSLVELNEDGELGTEIMTLAPGLYRCNPGQGPLLLVKEVVLVQLFKPLLRRRRPASGSQKQA